MQFKHPELLYALFFLLIPILVHLFQLRRFKKTPFTNVRFLKEVTLQTRKSSQIKKWLVLSSRLLALACIILAFAQPYLTLGTDISAEKETVVYLDNSYSMQAKGSRGELLKTAVTQLYENSDIPENLSWFTNTGTFKNVSAQDFRKTLLNTPYTASQVSLKDVLLKAENLFSKKENIEKNLILISDFQGDGNFPEVTENELNLSALQLKPSGNTNIAIDTLYISKSGSEGTEFTAHLKNFGEAREEIPVSLFSEETLIAKTSASYTENGVTTVIFDTPQTGSMEGRVSITDPFLNYDNDLYFSKSEDEKINVLVVNEGDDAFLRRIFASQEFDYLSFSLSQLDYNLILQQNIIILNELKEIPQALQTALKSFSENGGTLAIIPSRDAENDSYNPFLSSLGFGTFSSKKDQEKLITTIEFSHPLYKNVFEEEVRNFQYPKVTGYYELSGNNIPVLRFQDGTGYLVQNKNSYLFTASLKEENSNFKNSPLVVPTFYNIAKNSLPISGLYFHTGEKNSFAVPVQLSKDQILSIRNDEINFIPLQQNIANRVYITTTDMPSEAGIYGIYNDNQEIMKVSYNYPRRQSDLRYMDVSRWNGVEKFNSVSSLFDAVSQDRNFQFLWKWFVLFSLLFLAIEMFLLKFIK